MTKFTYDHIHLRSPNPEATAQYYERMFGAEVIRTMQQGKPRIDLKLGGANIFIAPVAPGEGVYAVRARTATGAAWPGAANVGANPTFGEEQRKIEVHLIGFSGDLYGQPLTVEFAARLRDTRPFAGAAELAEQLRRDVEQARGVLAS